MNELQLQIENLKTKISSGYVIAIEVDEGWYQLVLDCDTELTAIDPNYKVLQIKEKFGGLRYYMSPCNETTLQQRDAMYDVIRKYEEAALRTCEATGKPGLLMRSSRGWVKTLNPEYAASKPHYAKYVPALSHGWMLDDENQSTEDEQGEC